MKAKFILFITVILFTFNVGAISSSAEQMDGNENTKQTSVKVPEEQPAANEHTIEESKNETGRNVHTIKEPKNETGRNERITEEPIANDPDMFTASTVQNLKAATLSATTVQLSWSAVHNATGYEIYQSVNSENDFQLVGTASTTSHTLQNIVPGATNYFKVRAIQDAADKPIFSQFSSIVSMKTTLSAPTKLKATNKTHNSVTLSWQTVTGANGYEVYMSTSKNGKYKKVTTTTATSFKHANLATNKTYYYKIRAYTGTKPAYSPYSKIASAKIALDAPKNVKVKSKSYNSVTLSWSKVAGAKGYEIYMATSKNGKYRKVKTTTATSFKHANLTTNKTYYYKIRAYVKKGNKNDYSPFTKIINGKPALKKVPSVKTKGSASSITISWGPVSGATNYKVYRSTSKNGKYTLIKTTKSKSYTDKSVKKRKTYYYKIVATRTVGKKVYSGSPSAITSGITRAILEPNFSVYASDETYPDTSAVLFFLENHGPKPIRILATGSLHDYDYPSFDRALQQIDIDTLQDLDWLQIAGNSYGYVAYRVIGSPTWYDSMSTIGFLFMYDGVKYIGYVSNYLGSYYTEY